jgi:hypothetical protein
MELSIRNLLGLVDDGKREYRFSEDEVVTRDEFQYAKIIDGIVFGEKGYVETLGPTWKMIHDPRFSVIENCFIGQRRSLFGGDTRLGKQFISDEGIADSTMADLEQYSEILGEGRHFGEVLLLARAQGPLVHPSDLYKQSDDFIWNLIKQECPNYWSKDGNPNRLAQTIFACLKADMVGLLYDYSRVANVQEWVTLDTGDVIEETQIEDPEVKRVWLEVDLLDKALTQRAILRCTAAKILSDVTIKSSLRFANINIGENIKLTDSETDDLLRIIYQSEWPSNKLELALSINTFLTRCPLATFEERQNHQLAFFKQTSTDHCMGIINKSVAPITRYTDPEVDLPLTEEQELLNEILHNPLKQSLYLLYADAEKEGWTRVVDILSPVFSKPGFLIGEKEFTNYMSLCEMYIPEENNLKVISQIVEGENQAKIEDLDEYLEEGCKSLGQLGQLDAEIQREMREHEEQVRKPN